MDGSNLNNLIVPFQPIKYCLGQQIMEVINETQNKLREVEEELDLYHPNSEKCWKGRLVNKVCAKGYEREMTLFSELIANKVDNIVRIKNILEQTAKEFSNSMKTFGVTTEYEILCINRTLINLSYKCNKYLLNCKLI